MKGKNFTNLRNVVLADPQRAERVEAHRRDALADHYRHLPTLTAKQTAELYGISTDHLWALARQGRAPVEPLRLGRALRWPTALVLESLGLS